MCLYAQYLAYTFHSVKAIRNYLQGIKTLHQLLKVRPPNLKDTEVYLTLRALTKVLARPIRRAHPVTPEILLDLVAFLDLNKRADLVFWGILVIGFLGMLRKSNLVPDTVESFDPIKQLTRGHIEFREHLAVINVTWAKNIQNKEQPLEIPLFEFKDSVMCPIDILKALLKTPGKPHYPLFGYKKKVSYTYSQFQARFKKLLRRAGYKPELFSSHSLRRGGCVFAYRNGTPESLIQVHGCWASDAYKVYLQHPLEVRAVVALKMREGIMKLNV